MAELDPLVAEILLKGDDELLTAFQRIGGEGSEAFEKLVESIEHTGSILQGFANNLGAIEAVLSGAAAALTDFVEKQVELSQKTVLMAEAFGTSAGQLQELAATFAESGVKIDVFEKLVVRLTTTIAREFPRIAESVKEFANQSDAANNRVANSILAVREAQNRLSDNSASRAAQQEKDANGIAEAYNKLAFAAQHAAQDQLAAFQAVEGAQLGVVAAQQRLAALQGRPPSEAEKQNLAIAQAQQAVDQARAAEAAARLAQQEKAANAALKQAQLEQSYEDLRRKAAQNSRDDADNRLKDELRVQQAIIARGEAEDKVNKLALTSVTSIRNTLDEITKGNKDAAGAIDLTAVSVQNLTRGIIAQAAETAKGAKPTGYELLIQLSKTLSSATDEQITKDTQLALVQRLASNSLRSMAGGTAELLAVIRKGPGEFEKFSNGVKTSSINSEENQHRIEAFKGALADLNLQISQLSQALAVAISPAFTAFLNAIKDSITSDTGLIHEFIDGVTGIAGAFNPATDAMKEFGKNFDIVLVKIGDKNVITTLDLLKAALIGIGTALVVATGPIGVFIVAVGLIITAAGAVRDHFDQIKAAISHAWDAIKDNAVVQVFTTIAGIVVEIVKGVLQVANYLDRISSVKLPFLNGQAGGGGSGEGGNVEGHASGGHIRGPGSGTSDSILARLSNGEFVMKAAAVQNYGTGLFHALNNMQLPGFAAGGLVPSPVRLAGGGGSVSPTSTLNLSIDGRSFNGLRGPKSTIDDLSSFAISRQTSAAGSNPSWMK